MSPTLGDEQIRARIRCQEIMRAREEFCRLFFDPGVPPDSTPGLRRYFFGFAWAAGALHHRRQSGDHQVERREFSENR